VQNVVAAKRNVFPALFAPFVGDEVRKLIVAFGSGGMRFGCKRAMPFTRFFGRGNGLKREFESLLRGGMGRRKTENRSGGRGRLLELSRKREGQEKKGNWDYKSAQGKPHFYFVLQKNRNSAQTNQS